MSKVDGRSKASAGQIAKIVRLRNQNLGVSEIAREVGLTDDTVKRRLYQYMIDHGSNKLPPFRKCPPITRRVIVFLKRTLPSQSPMDAGVESDVCDQGLWTAGEVRELLFNEFGKSFPKDACSAMLRHLKIRGRKTTRSGARSRLESEKFISKSFARWSQSVKCEKQQQIESEAIDNYHSMGSGVGARNTARLAVHLSWRDPLIPNPDELNETIEEIVANL